MSTYFISDLHLDASRPAVTAQALAFLAGPARSADALYILGDLFEAWIGDDAAIAPADELADALQSLTRAGVPVYFIHGNRDFLLGADYARRTGMRLLPEPSVIDLYGTPTVIEHGDLLCTDDTAYLAFRAQSRDPAFIAGFLAQSPAQRQAFAEKARAASAAGQAAMKDRDQASFEAITDATEAAICERIARYGCPRLIHGHTHRPAVHTHALPDRLATRVVLGDWYEQGSVLEVDADGMILHTLQ
jgi:UDP-2,3-diacylglucosamine hydrolase